MKTRLSLVPLSLVLALTGCQHMEAVMPWVNAGNQMAKDAGYDTESRLVSGIKEALIKGTDTAAAQLSREGAMNLQLPDAAQPVANTLRQFGFGRYETSSNRHEPGGRKGRRGERPGLQKCHQCHECG